MQADLRLLEWSVAVARAPFSIPFRHASHARTMSESVLLWVRSSGGHSGWGEAAPRTYVTGETLESVVACLNDVPWRSWLLGSSLEEGIAAISTLMADFVLERPRSSAAAAAVETALLDLVCKAHGARMVDVLSHGIRVRLPALTLTVDVSQDPSAVINRMTGAEMNRLNVVKVKVGADIDEALDRLDGARRALPPKVRLAADANGAWNPAAALTRSRDLAQLGLSWVEEPFASRAWSDLAELEAAGVAVMADESFVGEDDLDHCARAGVSYVNVRVSKCGGPLRSLLLATRAQELDIAVQMGVQVGEIGPLWAAGRAVAASLPSLVALEAGRQDEWFSEALTAPPFVVDRSTHVASVPEGLGHGVTASPALTAHLTPRQPVETSETTTDDSRRTY